MAYPVPSEERTIHQRRFRGVRREYNLDTCQSYLHADTQHRELAVSTMANSPNFVERGLSQKPWQDKGQLNRRHIAEPRMPERHEGRRNPHRVPPISRTPDFPPGGMALRPERDMAVDRMASATTDVIHGHLSAQSDVHHGKRIFVELRRQQDAARRSGKGDASLTHNGVKRVNLEERNPIDNAVPGFRDMGRFSEPSDKASGKKPVHAREYDPLRFFQQYGRKYPPPLQMTTEAR